MRSSRDNPSEKPGRIQPHDWHNHAKSTRREAAAGAIHPSGDIRGAGATCRYHLQRIEKVASTPTKTIPSGKENTTVTAEKRAKQQFSEKSVDVKGQEVRRMLQDLMEKTLDADRKRAGWEQPQSFKALTPSVRTNDLMRFHGPPKGKAEVLSSPRAGDALHEPSPRARQDCRYHEAPPQRRSRSLTPDSGNFRRQFGPAMVPSGGDSDPERAGCNSNTRLRYDTPGGLSESLGRTRSCNPEYYNRYAANLAGALIACPPPDGTAAESQQHAHHTASCDPQHAELSSAVANRHLCRFHTSPDDHYGKKLVNNPRGTFPVNEIDDSHSVSSVSVSEGGRRRRSATPESTRERLFGGPVIFTPRLRSNASASMTVPTSLFNKGGTPAVTDRTNLGRPATPLSARRH